MDRIEQAAIHAVMADLANDGGGTYQANTFLPFRPASGFAVGAVAGIALPFEVVTPSMVSWALRQVARENASASYVGTWLDEGVVYFDAVHYFSAERERAAREAGRHNGQQAIFDFGAKESVAL